MIHSFWENEANEKQWRWQVGIIVLKQWLEFDGVSDNIAVEIPEKFGAKNDPSVWSLRRCTSEVNHEFAGI